MAPAAVKTAIRHNDFEKAADFERALALSGSSFAVAIAVPSLSTRIIPDSQPLKLSVAEATSVHQRKASNSGDLLPSVTKKPHIPLNGAGFPSSGAGWQIRPHDIAASIGGGDQHDIPDLKPM
jgi:hypothetical protein